MGRCRGVAQVGAIVVAAVLAGCPPPPGEDAGPGDRDAGPAARDAGSTDRPDAGASDAGVDGGASGPDVPDLGRDVGATSFLSADLDVVREDQDPGWGGEGEGEGEGPPELWDDLGFETGGAYEVKPGLVAHAGPHRDLALVDLTDPSAPTLRPPVESPGAPRSGRMESLHGLGTRVFARVRYSNLNDVVVVDFVDDDAPAVTTAEPTYLGPQLWSALDADAVPPKLYVGTRGLNVFDVSTWPPTALEGVAVDGTIVDGEVVGDLVAVSYEGLTANEYAGLVDFTGSSPVTGAVVVPVVLEGDRLRLIDGRLRLGSLNGSAPQLRTHSTHVVPNIPLIAQQTIIGLDEWGQILHTLPWVAALDPVVPAWRVVDVDSQGYLSAPTSVALDLAPFGSGVSPDETRAWTVSELSGGLRFRLHDLATSAGLGSALTELDVGAAELPMGLTVAAASVWWAPPIALFDVVSLASGDQTATEEHALVVPVDVTGGPTDEPPHAAVVVTFSSTTMTFRAFVPATRPQHALVTGGGALALFSRSRLAVVELDDASPATVTDLDLSPPHRDLVRLADGHLIRLMSGRVPRADVLAPGTAPDLGAALGSFPLSQVTRVHPIGDSRLLLIGDGEVRVVDLTDPAAPVLSPALPAPTLARASPWPVRDWPPCRLSQCDDDDLVEEPDTAAVNGGAVFLVRQLVEEAASPVDVCRETPTNTRVCEGEGDDEVCSWVEGERQCVSLVGEGFALCSGSFRRCSMSSDPIVVNETCEPPIDDDADIDFEILRQCEEVARLRRHEPFALELLTPAMDPASAPTLTTVDTPEEAEAGAVLVDGDDVWLSWKRPEPVAGTPLAYQRWYAQRASIDEAGTLVLDAPINVPGTLVGVDGAVLFTHEARWTEDGSLERSFHRVRVAAGVATLEASIAHDQGDPRSLHLDGTGRLIAIWGPAFSTRTLHVYDAAATPMTQTGEGEFDGDLLAVAPGKAIVADVPTIRVLDTSGSTLAETGFFYTPWAAGRVDDDDLLFIDLQERLRIEPLP